MGNNEKKVVMGPGSPPPLDSTNYLIERGRLGILQQRSDGTERPLNQNILLMEWKDNYNDIFQTPIIIMIMKILVPSFSC